MKRMILLALILLLPSSRLIAQLPPQGYIGLFTDDSHNEWCVANIGGIYNFTMWVWCLPSERGQMCVEFGISYPTNLILSTVTLNH
jgi:hypothetical protein